jgi:histidinol dehydrogenase
MTALKIERINGMLLSEETLWKFFPRGQSNLDTIKDKVQLIVDTVQKGKDNAIKEFTKQFDKINLSETPLRVTEEEIDKAFELIPASVTGALKTAKINIEKFHAAQIREEWSIETSKGVKAGQIMRPIESVGLYIPGGKAVYPSSVLMEAIPAKVAGVKKLILCSPPQKDGNVDPAILVAARLCEVDYIFRCGGAQAIAGMAYGTESIPNVQKIVGPGNKWVAAAKQLVSHVCAIDNPAGPSEILLVVDGNVNPKWAAFDLLAQAEHGPDNVAILLSDNEKIIEQILTELSIITENSPRKDLIEKNLNDYGLVITANNTEEILRVINMIAAEHLQLSVVNPRDLLPDIYNAGAIFLGEYSPVPLGDYCAGTNHVLPTAGYAKTYSGLSTLDFVKIIDVLDCSKEGLRNLAPTLKEIARFEGLDGHIDAVLERLDEGSGKK